MKKRCSKSKLHKGKYNQKGKGPGIKLDPSISPRWAHLPPSLPHPPSLCMLRLERPRGNLILAHEQLLQLMLCSNMGVSLDLNLLHKTGQLLEENHQQMHCQMDLGLQVSSPSKISSKSFKVELDWYCNWAIWSKQTSNSTKCPQQSQGFGTQPWKLALLLKIKEAILWLYRGLRPPFKTSRQSNVLLTSCTMLGTFLALRRSFTRDDITSYSLGL